MTTFIGNYAIDPGICDELIHLHNNNPNKGPGRVGDGEIKPDVKSSTDTDYWADENDTIKKYVGILQRCLEEYMRTYRWSDENQEEFSISEKISLQHYAPGQGYPQWHYENNGNIVCRKRHLAFMTFLNTVTDEGHTEFWYQKYRKAPLKGLTMIWPAQWTHAHHGIKSMTEDKYIITGWYSWLDENDKTPTLTRAEGGAFKNNAQRNQHGR